jgi:hypothetical protein
MQKLQIGAAKPPRGMTPLSHAFAAQAAAHRRWECLGSTPGGERNMDCILEEIQPQGSICKYIGWLVCSMGPTTNMAPINAGQDNLGPRVNYLGKI